MRITNNVIQQNPTALFRFVDFFGKEKKIRKSEKKGSVKVSDGNLTGPDKMTHFRIAK